MSLFYGEIQMTWWLFALTLIAGGWFGYAVSRRESLSFDRGWYCGKYAGRDAGPKEDGRLRWWVSLYLVLASVAIWGMWSGIRWAAM